MGSFRTLITVPGWATDSRLFEGVSFPFESVVHVHDCMGIESQDQIVAAVQTAAFLGPVSVLGFSMGGFAVVECLPQIQDQVTQVILVGIRQRYPQSEIDQVKSLISAGKARFLRSFYKSGFPSRVWQPLFDSYLAQWDEAALCAGLDRLGSLEIKPEALLCPEKITVVHGLQDAIAPIAEARVLAQAAGAKWQEIEGPHYLPLDRVVFF